MDEKPNVLIVVTDQQRPDSLGCYGGLIAETPHTDALCASGLRFENAYTTYPVCTPARGTMWTGLYPHATGIERNIVDRQDLLSDLPERPVTVFDSVRSAGYRTGYFGKWHLGLGDPGLCDVWEAFNSQGGHWLDGRQSFQGGTYAPDHQTDQAMSFIDAASGEAPFLAVVSYYPPHDPYTAPVRFYQRYRGRVPFAGYYAGVAALDWNLGRLVACLERNGVRDDTLVLFFSDHGETFSYRGAPHKFVCTEDAVRIPLIASWPNRIAPGISHDCLVGLQDVMPTVLDCCGLDVPARLHGASLTPWFDGRARRWRDIYYIENHTYGERVAQRAVRTQAHKLILDAEGRHHLYDLTVDPEEELNLYGAPRPDPQRQFNHFPDQAPMVRSLAARLGDEAHGLDDAVGVRLAQDVLGRA